MRLLKCIVLLITFALSSQAAALDFKFKDVNGQHRKLSDYRGTWTIVNYWGVNCPPCRAEVPALNRIERQYRGKAKIIGIELMSSPNKKIRNFMKNNGMRFTVAGTQRSVVNPLGKIRRLPTTFIISPEGQLVKRHQGILKEHHVRALINQPSKKSKKQAPAKQQQKVAPAKTYAPKAQTQVNAPSQHAQVKPKQAAKVVVPKKKAPSKKVNDHDFLMNINPDDFF